MDGSDYTRHSHTYAELPFKYLHRCKSHAAVGWALLSSDNSCLQLFLDFDGNLIGSSCGDMLRYPSLTSQNLQLGEVMKKNLVCSSIRHRNGFFHTTKLTLKANRTWKETAE